MIPVFSAFCIASSFTSSMSISFETSASRRIFLASPIETFLFLFPILVVLFGLDGIDQPKTIPNQDNSDVIEQLNHQVSVSKSHMKIGSLISGLVMFQVILLTLMASNEP